MTSLIGQHIVAVEALYEPVINDAGSRLHGGSRLWAQFKSAAAAAKTGDARAIASLVERVNELVVGKLILDDSVEGERHYGPDLLPDGRRIDFVVMKPDENIYIEVKTVHPTQDNSEEAWRKFVARRKRHPANVHYLVNKEWLGAQIYGSSFSARGHFLDYARQFEERLAAAQAVRPGVGILAFCGTGFDWHLSELEDFADFYSVGRHRSDDPFAAMEGHELNARKISLRRNITHFAFIKRGMDKVKAEQRVMPVRGSWRVLFTA